MKVGNPGIYHWWTSLHRSKIYALRSFLLCIDLENMAHSGPWDWEKLLKKKTLFLKIHQDHFIQPCGAVSPQAKSTAGNTYLFSSPALATLIPVAGESLPRIILLILPGGVLESFCCFSFKSFRHIAAFFIEVELIYSIMLVSGVHQSDSVKCIYAYIHILFSTLFPL